MLIHSNRICSQKRPLPSRSALCRETVISKDIKDRYSTASTAEIAPTPTELSTEEYHKLSDTYLDELLSELEELQENREDMDIEYHVSILLAHAFASVPLRLSQCCSLIDDQSGVMTIVFPPAGTYVLNKQPPSRQIWLSSPISGPKRYDWVMPNNRPHDKASATAGRWIYLRDSSTLTDVLRTELGVNMNDV